MSHFVLNIQNMVIVIFFLNNMRKFGLDIGIFKTIRIYLVTIRYTNKASINYHSMLMPQFKVSNLQQCKNVLFGILNFSF